MLMRPDPGANDGSATKMNHAPKSTAAFDELIALLQQIRDGYVLNEQRFTDPLDVIEGYRYVGQLLSATSELFFEADPDHPRLVSIVSPSRKLQGDNPDAIYHYARISGSRSYRIFGRVDRECYTSFTVHGRAPDGAMAGPLLGDINDRQFVSRPGRFVLFDAQRHRAARKLVAPRSRCLLHCGAQLFPAGNLRTERRRCDGADGHRDT